MRTALRVGIMGARGFVGAALARRLAADGVEVVALNRPTFDLTDRGTWGALDCGLDVLVHAAGGPGATTWDMFRVNTTPCEALAQRLNALGLRRLVYLSTGRVYGYHPHPAFPGMDCTPVGDYPVSKYVAERVLAETFAGELSLARLYYPYGPGQKPPRVFPRLAAQVAAGETVTCAEGGGPRLSVSHIDDLTAVLSRDFIRAATVPAIANLASPSVVTIAGIARMLGEKLGRAPVIVERGAALDEFSEPYGDFDWRPFRVEDILPPG